MGVETSFRTPKLKTDPSALPGTSQGLEFIFDTRNFNQGLFVCPEQFDFLSEMHMGLSSLNHFFLLYQSIRFAAPYVLRIRSSTAYNPHSQ